MKKALSILLALLSFATIMAGKTKYFTWNPDEFVEAKSFPFLKGKNVKVVFYDYREPLNYKINKTEFEVVKDSVFSYVSRLFVDANMSKLDDSDYLTENDDDSYLLRIRVSHYCCKFVAGMWKAYFFMDIDFYKGKDVLIKQHIEGAGAEFNSLGPKNGIHALRRAYAEGLEIIATSLTNSILEKS